MEKINITFADTGMDNTSFAAKLLVQRGAKKVSIAGDDYMEAVGNCDVILDSGDLDYDVLRGIRPDIILATITPFGLTGLKAEWKGDSYIAAAAGGSMHMCGLPDREPLAPAGAQAEKIAGLFAVNGILLALLEKRQTGKGKHLDISMQEAVAGALDLVLVRSFYYGEDPYRTGSLAWGKQNFIVPCSNGHIMVHIRPADWQTIVDWMDGDGMAADLKDEIWNNREYRESHYDHVVKVVSEWSRSYEKEELFETAQLMRMAWAIVKEATV